MGEKFNSIEDVIESFYQSELTILNFLLVLIQIHMTKDVITTLFEKKTLDLLLVLILTKNEKLLLRYVTIESSFQPIILFNSSPAPLK